VHVVVEPRVDAVAGQDREADLLERRAECGGEARPVRRIAVQILPEIERRDLEILVERVARMLCKAIGVRLADLVVAAEILVERLVRGGVRHAQASSSEASGAVAGSALPSRQPLSAAWAMIAAA
jgi:hypothetical protein